MIDSEQHEERICICVADGIPDRWARRIADLEFWKSVKLPDAEARKSAAALGWSESKTIRMVNR